jgi:hypothetical protein
MAVRRLASSCEKTTQQSVPWSFLFPSPTPPRKNHPQPTQKRLPIKTSPSPVPDQGADSPGSPHLRINCADLTEDSSPGTNKRPRATRRCPRNGPGPPGNPPQSGGQPTHLPHLPRTGVKKLTRRQDSQRT